MDKITQEAYFRQRVLKYASEHGITASANRNRISRKTVHKWKKRYDGTIESLKSEFPKRMPLWRLLWKFTSTGLVTSFD